MNNSTSNSRPTFSNTTPEFVFKIFYDPETKECISKTDGSEISELPFIVVDHAIYNSVDMCNNFKVADGELVRNKRRSKYKKIEKMVNGKFKTIKNNMIFIVDDNYIDAIDTWNYYSNE